MEPLHRKNLVTIGRARCQKAAVRLSTQTKGAQHRPSSAASLRAVSSCREREDRPTVFALQPTSPVLLGKPPGRKGEG
jgi:hypothetical protein